MNILERIAADKRPEIERLCGTYTLAGIRRLAERHPIRRDPARVLARPGVSLIAEIKKASPSRGVLRARFDPVALALDYVAAGADMISVITEANHFQGSPRFLAAVRERVRVPLLRKDFIVDLHQVAESKLLGADMLLLIAALLKERLPEFVDEARRVGIAALVEVHNEAEMAAAAAAHAGLIGINNRDLSDFTVDLSTFERLAPLAPPGALLVAESGIETAEHVQRMARAGAAAVLVGEHLVRHEHPARAARALLA